jgi:thiol-disulfide isomerase/thioredoxin
MALLVLITLLPLPAGAEELALKPLASGKTITLKEFRGSPLLLAFWRSDCAPCMTETPILLEIAKQHAALNIAIVSLQDEAHTRKHLAARPAPNIQVLIAAGDAKQTLEGMDDARAALPYSVFLSADGSVCRTHTGLLGTDTVDEWIKRC